MLRLSPSNLRPLITPLVLILLLAALWLWIRYGYLTGGGGERTWRSVAANVFIGWLAIVFLTTTAASVIWSAADHFTAFLKFAILVDGAALLVLWTGWGTGLIGFIDVLRLYALLAAWGIAWLELSRLLRLVIGNRPAPAIALSLTAAMILFSGPVTMVPLARASATWRPGAQDRIVSAIGFTTPMLGALGAIRNSVRIDWPQLPLMYHLSVLGQDIPMALPTWWMNTLLYAAVGAVCWAAAAVTNRRIGDPANRRE